MVLGTYKEVVAARSTDKQIQKIAQDGGIVSALFCYALDEKLIDGAVVAGPTEELWKPAPTVAMTAEEVLAAAGTKYTFSPNVWMLKKAARQYGLEKIGTVFGTPMDLVDSLGRFLARSAPVLYALGL